MKNLCLTFLLLFIGTIQVFAQKIKIDPIDWQPTDTVTIYVDVSGTNLSGISSDLYLWAWTKSGSGESIDSPNNGIWATSSPTAKFTALGNDRYKISFFPNEYFGMDSELLKVSGIYFLIKTIDGSDQSDNLGPYKPFSEDGISKNTDWNATRKVRILMDTSASGMGAGTSPPFYFWGFYNNGSGDVTALGNGSWTNPSTSSQMTQIPGTSVWYIDLIPTEYFSTTASNLSPTTVFGLIKTFGGTNQTADFGNGKPNKHYEIYQLNASNVTVTPTLPDRTNPVTITFEAKESLAGATGDIFLHSAVVTDGLNSTAWNYAVGDWGSPTSPGKMTNIAPNIYEITLPSINAYYGVPTSENVYKIMAVFRNADGTIQEKDGDSDYQLPVQLQAGLEIREPQGSFVTGQINEPFRITGFNPETSNFELYVNNVLIHDSTATTRASRLYTPTTSENYWVKIKSTIGSTIYQDSVLVVVCSTTSKSKLATLPAGLKYGINYNASDFTKATLVLHAPTESITNVHVIGDFNDWTVNCNYLMKYDNSKKVFWLELTGLTSGQEYVFQYLIDGKTRIGDSYTKKVSDPWNDASIPSATYPGLIPYPTAARPKAGETPTIASVLQTNQPAFVWESTSFERKALEKQNIYQLHFRDFTVEGTYLAAIEKLDYLQRLGITAIETLPVSEFEGNDSWGYNPNYYFAVDKAYGTENDYKLFVNECHKRGMAVIGDIVLNHAFGTNPMARMYWDDVNERPASNNPWFNTVSNFATPGAQWGNDFNHESPHTKAFVDSVITYWLTEFKIDGIRFDFTKGFGNTPYPNGSCGDEWGGCYDATRINLLKRMTDHMRSVTNGTPGVVPYVIMEHLAHIDEDKNLSDYGIGLWSGVVPNHKYSQIAMGYDTDSDVSISYYKNKGFTEPNWISYMESHDEERLAYAALTYGNGAVKTDDSLRSQFLQAAAVMNLLIRGPRQIWQFGELGYDYSINYNGRTGKKPVRWDYFDETPRKKIYNTYSKLFWLRNHMPGTFIKDIDEGYGGLTDFASQFKRYHYYNSVGDTAVTIIANTANSVISGNPKFNDGSATQWYDFMSGDTVLTSTNLTLQPGQFMVLMNKLPQITSAITLTDAINPTLGWDSTNLNVTFSEPFLRVDGILGRTVLSSDLSMVFEIYDASNNPIAFSGTVENYNIIINPTTLLPAGTYTLKLKSGYLQNYGGLKYPEQIFNFTIQATCHSSPTLVSTTDDLLSGTKDIMASGTITASHDVKTSGRQVLQATNAVILQPGFIALPGSTGVFEAKIGGCP